MGNPGSSKKLLRLCKCGCGEPAKKFYSGDQFKSWMRYAEGHAPNARIVPRIPELISDLAYAAGIVDGEGCISATVSVNKDGFNQTSLVLQVCMCSQSVITWLADHFGGGVMSRKAKGRWRIRYSWRMRGRRVGPILRAIIPYMIEKREQAIFAIEISDRLNQSLHLSRYVKPEDLSRRTELATAIKRLNNPTEDSELSVQ